MGVLIIFEKIPHKAIEQVSVLKNQLLFEWTNKNICLPLEVDANSDIEFTQEHLDKLIADLKAANVENCHAYFPCWGGEYDDNYWYSLKELKEWAEQMLACFDFKNDKLMFSCSW